jgi:hypothetical protein
MYEGAFCPSALCAALNPHGIVRADDYDRIEQCNGILGKREHCLSSEGSGRTEPLWFLRRSNGLCGVSAGGRASTDVFSLFVNRWDLC